jgi:hypothetical protein
VRLSLLVPLTGFLRRTTHLKMTCHQTPRTKTHESDALHSHLSVRGNTKPA